MKKLVEKRGISIDEALNIAEKEECAKGSPARRSKKKRRKHPGVRRSQEKKTRIRLISKRGKKLTGRHQCANCEKFTHNPVRYAESNIGPVILCASCKTRLRKQSFPDDFKKIDALDRAQTGGNSFEGNKRSH